MDSLLVANYLGVVSFYSPEQPNELGAEERARLIAALREALGSESAVRVAFLFGSFARNERFRDIDIGVELDEPFTAMDVARLSTRLWLAVGQPRFELDVLPLNDAPPSFRLEVADTGLPLRERWPGASSDFAVAALSEKLDFEEALRVIAAE